LLKYHNLIANTLSNVWGEEWKTISHTVADFFPPNLIELGLPEQTYELPDGQNIVIKNECFEAAEILFYPQLVGNDPIFFGIHKLVYFSIKYCDAEIRNELYKNIVLAGGNTMFSGIETRLQNELNTMMKEDKFTINIEASEDGSCLHGEVARF